MDSSILRGAQCCVSRTAARIDLIGVAVFATLSLLGGFFHGAAAGEQKRLDVLELFTSQGCSSCPPADVLLQQFSQRDNVLALSFPVNYWDHLGWRDTLAKDAYNERQRDYAAARGDREIYTPQIVVNGIAHAVGSQKSAIEAAIAQTGRQLHAAWVPVSLECGGGDAQLKAGDAPAGSEFRSGKLWLALYSNSVTVDIGRGENYGRDITYTNVVRHLVPAGNWEGREARYKVKIPQGASFDGCAALLQSDKSHAMLGASAVTVAAR
jgi:hypothetical protein